MSNGKFTADLEKSAVIVAKNTFVSTDTNHPGGLPLLKGAANILDGGGA
jgi:hypothetical protein